MLAPLTIFAQSPDLETRSAGEGKGTAVVRVMTYNIHHARGMDGKVDPRRIAAIIRQEQPDIVALQEVDRGVPRSAGRDLTRELAEMTGMSGYFEKNHQYVDVWEEAGEGDGFTHSSDGPNKRIDYIWLLRNSGLHARRAWVVPTQASDHLPLVAEVEVRVEEK